ncbi:hypothetical protein [Microbacterium sp. P05]|uniref:hypothetical protein n=1 Tax=Microbacterium sp. P05 TaxID=3366948 RepID=UPI0037469385
MKISLREVRKGRAERALPDTTLSYESGHVTLAMAETEQRPTVLGLLASGRMRPDTGEVHIDGRKDAATIRKRVALVDAPHVSEPESGVSVGGVVAEELMFAGRAPNPFAARRWLDTLGLGELAGTPIGNIAPGQRIRILLELAALRDGVEGIVLASPDRHGGEPTVWWRLAEEFAGRGYAVLVIAGKASRSALRAAGKLPDEEESEPEDEPDSRTPEIEVAPEPEPIAEPEAEPVPEPEPEPEPDPESQPEPTPASDTTAPDTTEPKGDETP